LQIEQQIVASLIDQLLKRKKEEEEEKHTVGGNYANERRAK